MKFIFCVCSNLYPISVDDPNFTHDSTIIIEDENQTLRISLGLDKDDKLSRSCLTYFTRVLSKEKMINFRDALTDLINKCN